MGLLFMVLLWHGIVSGTFRVVDALKLWKLRWLKKLVDSNYGLAI